MAVSRKIWWAVIAISALLMIIVPVSTICMLYCDSMTAYNNFLKIRLAELMIQKSTENVWRHVNIVTFQNTLMCKSVNANVSHNTVQADLHKILTPVSVLASKHVQLAIL